MARRKPKTSAEARPSRALKTASGETAGKKRKVADADCDESFKRRRPSYDRKTRLSRDEILSISERAEEEPVAPIDHSALFAAGSTANLTWGIMNTEPVVAVAKVRRFSGLKRSKNRRTSRGKDDMDQNEVTTEMRPANERKGFQMLRLPWEIREMIYGYFLFHQRAILVHCDWRAIQNSSSLDLVILQICWQITTEAACFLYQRNVFHALVRANNPSWKYEQCIYPKYIPFFRNVVIECPKENWSLEWAKMTTTCIKTLVEANTVLDSLTMIIMPKKIGLTTTLVGGESNYITFVNFFFKESLVMRELMRLRCKVFNLVVRIPEKKRIVLSLNVRHLECNYTTSQFVDDQASKAGRLARAKEAKERLEGLKAAVECVVEDWEAAVRQGVGRLMGEGESLSDGMRLMKA